MYVYDMIYLKINYDNNIFMILKKTFYTSLRNINLVKYKITNNLYDSNKR